MEKELEYNGRIIKYKVIKKKIKNMYIRIKDGNVVVSVPKTIAGRTIESFVVSKSSWIFTTLDKFEKNKLYKSDDNSVIRLFGNSYNIYIKYEVLDILYEIDKLNNVIIIYLPKEYENLDENKLSSVISNYKQYIYADVLKDVLENAFKKYQKLTGLKVNKYTLKPMKSAWGRCSSNKSISINIELAKYSIRAIESVVLHEICHIKYMNHSKEYWNYVKKNMPDYDIIKKELKKIY